MCVCLQPVTDGHPLSDVALPPILKQDPVLLPWNGLDKRRVGHFSPTLPPSGPASRTGPGVQLYLHHHCCGPLCVRHVAAICCTRGQHQSHGHCYYLRWCIGLFRLPGVDDLLMINSRMRVFV